LQAIGGHRSDSDIDQLSFAYLAAVGKCGAYRVGIVVPAIGVAPVAVHASTVGNLLAPTVGVIRLQPAPVCNTGASLSCSASLSAIGALAAAGLTTC
tara:strand:- start:15404 stop:15694 length:291 start_codon:yes stop_codon:yes gene_type:complete